MSIESKFYYPEVGLDDAKTAEDHFKDLRYYVQDGNIPAIEKIEEICSWMKMLFEADICKFAKQSVEIDNEGKMPYNIADIKKDVAEALRDDGFYFGEIEFNENERNTSIHVNAHISEDDKNLDNAEVSITLFEMTGIGTEKERESFGAARISFDEFKQMPAHGFNVEHKSFDSLLNEIRAYSDIFERTEAWKPSNKKEKVNTKEKDLNFER